MLHPDTESAANSSASTMPSSSRTGGRSVPPRGALVETRGRYRGLRLGWLRNPMPRPDTLHPSSPGDVGRLRTSASGWAAQGPCTTCTAS